jgi:enamine deaminase RidA (YjgF/YER057c/UK114 family)
LSYKEIPHFMGLEFLNPPGMNIQRAADRAYGYGVRADNLVFLSGQVGRDHDGAMVGLGDPEQQAIQAFENMKTVVECAGGTMADIITCRMYIIDRAHLPVIMQTRKRYFPGPNYPTNAVLICAGLSSPEYLLELEAVAYIPR